MSDFERIDDLEKEVAEMQKVLEEVRAILNRAGWKGDLLEGVGWLASQYSLVQATAFFGVDANE